MRLQTLSRFPVRHALASMALAVILLAGYALLADPVIGFIPDNTQQTLSFNLFEQPQNALWFVFVHTGLQHLAANLLIIILFGWITLELMSLREAMFLFWSASIVAVAVFNLWAPGVYAIGASGGAVAFVTVALLWSPAKSAAALVCVVASLAVLSGAILVYQQHLQSDLLSERATAIQNVQAAQAAHDDAALERAMAAQQQFDAQLQEQDQLQKLARTTRVGHEVHLLAALWAVGWSFARFSPQLRRALSSHQAYLAKWYPRRV